MNRQTKIINLISWPWVWKSVLAALIFVHMKIKWYNIEYVTEYAKQLVWAKEFDILNNQYYVSKQQYHLFKSMDWIVDYIVTDWSLLHWLHYNRINNENTSDILKTEKKILEYYKEFDNINIFLERNPKIPYEKAWRIQSIQEAIESDNEILEILNEFKIPYKKIISDVSSIDILISYIESEKCL